MTVPTTIDPGSWLNKYLTADDGDTDLARALLAAFAQTLMSADAQAVCGAEDGERTRHQTTPDTDPRPAIDAATQAATIG